MDYLSVRKNIFGILFLAVTVGIFLAGLWPLNFWPENKVRWLKDHNGVQFYGQGIIYSTIPFIQYSTNPMKSFSIEICLQPEEESYDYTACILCIYVSQASETLFITQWKTHLIIEKRINTMGHGEKYQKISLRDAFQKGLSRFLTITSGSEGTKIYIDEKLVKEYPKFNLFTENKTVIDQLILGNAPAGKQSWTGNLLHLAFYDHSLTGEQVLQHFQKWSNNESSSLSREEGLIAFYLFDEHSGTVAYDHVGGHHLLMKPRYEAFQKRVLISPWGDFQLNRSYLRDILTNILGFIPFGFFFSAYLWARSKTPFYRLLLISILFGGCISLAIELIQVYLPTRSSQLIDVIMNILGGAIGVALFFKTHKS